RQLRFRVGHDVHGAVVRVALAAFNRAAESMRVIRNLTVGCEIAEPGDAGLEVQFDGAGRAVALLADDDFGLAMGQFQLHLPFFVLGGAGARLLVGEVVFLAIHEHHDVGVLLDRAGFTQVGKLGALVVAVFDLSRELRQRDHG
ncbi:hypothetical protein chiPu_0033706, partial [Chiloscyllium punctatum]|nr:hypothetical protein [Chiloscyllium punctatum]